MWCGQWVQDCKKNASCWTWLLIVLNLLTVLTTNQKQMEFSWSQNLKTTAKLGNVKNSFWVKKLDRCSFQVPPHCLTWTQTDGNTICTLVYTSISGMLCLVKTLEVHTYKKSQSWLSILFKMAVTKCKWYILNEVPKYSNKQYEENVTWNVHGNLKSIQEAIGNTLW